MFENRYFINKRNYNIVTTWLMILIILLLIFLNIFFNYEYKNSDQRLGYIKNIDGFKLVVYVEEDEISKISSYDLLIDGLKYDFEIVSISEEYYIVDNQKCYEIILNVSLSEELLIENNLINLVFEKNTTTLYSELKKGIKQWIN